jgi:hypothetical protein
MNATSIGKAIALGVVSAYLFALVNKKSGGLPGLRDSVVSHAPPFATRLL